MLQILHFDSFLPRAPMLELPRKAETSTVKFISVNGLKSYLFLNSGRESVMIPLLFRLTKKTSALIFS